MRFYASVFADVEIGLIERYGAGELGAEGSVKRAAFTLCGQHFICIDSPVKHAFTFTPSMSIHVECENEAELGDAYTRLSEGGDVLMPIDNYGFSTRFAWVRDRFGVSWQLHLE